MLSPDAVPLRFQLIDSWLAVFGILIGGVGDVGPFTDFVALCWEPAVVAQHLGGVHQVPGHHGGVLVRELAVMSICMPNAMS